MLLAYILCINNRNSLEVIETYSLISLIYFSLDQIQPLTEETNVLLVMFNLDMQHLDDF